MYNPKQRVPVFGKMSAEWLEEDEQGVKYNTDNVDAAALAVKISMYRIWRSCTRRAKRLKRVPDVDRDREQPCLYNNSNTINLNLVVCRPINVSLLNLVGLVKGQPRQQNIKNNIERIKYENNNHCLTSWIRHKRENDVQCQLGSAPDIWGQTKT